LKNGGYGDIFEAAHITHPHFLVTARFIDLWHRQGQVCRITLAVTAFIFNRRRTSRTLAAVTACCINNGSRTPREQPAAK
jgi:hypothetical protein